ncbi:hypothetical protein LCGC14_1024730 [marine sediment metagenome]|uniref:Uncharacterized protein n=1 Tax=marine sediment metagenome TaxID=412755 RepID=A0A0F9R276_9ZZZZ
MSTPPQLPPMPGPSRLDPRERTRNFWSKLHKLPEVINRPLRFVAGEGNDILYRFLQFLAMGVMAAILVVVSWMILSSPWPDANGKPSMAVGPPTGATRTRPQGHRRMGDHVAGQQSAEVDVAGQQSAEVDVAESQIVLPVKRSSSRPKPPNFRNVKWGMSKGEVKQTEPDKPANEDEDTVSYKRRLANLDCYLIYVFVEHQLIRASYTVLEEHANENLFLADYRKLKNELAKKYGRPFKDETIWRGSGVYKNMPAYWGQAVATGAMVKCANWETAETNIILMLKGDNFDVDLCIEYASKRFEPLAEKAAAQAISDSL